MTAAHRRLLLATTASGLGDDARMFAGPLLGALLCARAAPLPFVLDAASFAAAFVLLLGLPRGSRQVATARAAQWHEDMLAGARYLLANRTLRILGLLLGLVNLAAGASFPVPLLFARHILPLDPAGFGRHGGGRDGCRPARSAGADNAGRTARARRSRWSTGRRRSRYGLRTASGGSIWPSDLLRSSV